MAAARGLDLLVARGPWLHARPFTDLPTQVRQALQPPGLPASPTQIQSTQASSTLASFVVDTDDMPPSSLASFVNGLDNFFQVSQQPHNKIKREATTGSKPSSPKEDVDALLEPPLAKPQARWIQEAVGCAFGAFGDHIEATLGALTTRLPN